MMWHVHGKWLMKVADRVNKEAEGETRDQKFTERMVRSEEIDETDRGVAFIIYDHYDACLGLQNDAQKISKSFTELHVQGLHPLIRIISQREEEKGKSCNSSTVTKN